MADGIAACRADIAAAVRRGEMDNAGLALSRYITHLSDKSEAVCRAYDGAVNTEVSEGYKASFIRWKEQHSGRGSRFIPMRLAAPLAIGLGNQSPSGVGITLQHTYGTPVIPGSAVKGLCLRAALRLKSEEKIKQKQIDRLFGTTEFASHFVFWDAWYDPGSIGGKPFHRDVITVHHPKYYRSRGTDAWPTDFDDPNPISFLVIKPEAEFLFILTAPEEEWANFAASLLEWSLRNLGVGAKTSSGYGRFKGPSKSRPKGAGTKKPTPQSEGPVYREREKVQCKVLKSGSAGTVELPDGSVVKAELYNVNEGQTISMTILSIGGDGKIKKLKR